jgi:DNA-binding response OmpR family regulator
VSTKRVLVIDDEANVREIVQACLQDLGGWEVSEAAPGPEGLIKAVLEQPDAIVLDLMLPQTDGLAFLRKLRMHSVTETIPIVILTTKAYLAEPKLLSQFGVMGTIAKPFNPVTLSNQIAAVLGWKL